MNARDVKFNSSIWEWGGAHWRMWFTRGGEDVGWEITVGDWSDATVKMHPVRVDARGGVYAEQPLTPTMPPSEAVPPTPEGRHDPTAPIGLPYDAGDLLDPGGRKASTPPPPPPPPTGSDPTLRAWA